MYIQGVCVSTEPASFLPFRLKAWGAFDPSGPWWRHVGLPGVLRSARTQTNKHNGRRTCKSCSRRCATSLTTALSARWDTRNKKHVETCSVLQSLLRVWLTWGRWGCLWWRPSSCRGSFLPESLCSGCYGNWRWRLATAGLSLRTERKLNSDQELDQTQTLKHMWRRYLVFGGTVQPGLRRRFVFRHLILSLLNTGGTFHHSKNTTFKKTIKLPLNDRNKTSWCSFLYDRTDSAAFAGVP